MLEAIKLMLRADASMAVRLLMGIVLNHRGKEESDGSVHFQNGDRVRVPLDKKKSIFFRCVDALPGSVCTSRRGYFKHDFISSEHGQCPRWVVPRELRRANDFQRFAAGPFHGFICFGLNAR